MRSREDILKILNKINVKIQLAPKDITGWDIIKLYWDYPYEDALILAQSLQEKLPKSLLTAPQMIKEIADFLNCPDINIRQVAEKILKATDDDQVKGMLTPTAMNLRWIASPDLDPYLLSEAARYLGEIGEPQGVEPLIKALAHPHKLVRGNAAAALGKIGEIKAIPYLLPLLADEDLSVQEKTAVAMLHFPDKRAILPLIAAYKNNYQGQEVAQIRLRKHCSQALIMIGLPAAIVLNDLAHHDKIPAIRIWALTLLLIMGLMPVREFVQITSENDIDQNLPIADRIIRDLGKDISEYKEYFIRQIHSTNNLEFLKRIIYVQEREMKTNAIKRIYQLDNEVFNDIFSEILIGNWPREKEVFMEFGDLLIPSIKQLLYKCGPNIRLNCLQLLGELGNLKGFKMIHDHFNDTDQEVRKAAIKVGLKLKPTGQLDIPVNGIPLLIELIGSELENKALNELKSIGAPVVDVIKEDLLWQNEEYLRKVIFLLEQFGDNKAVGLLAKIWRHNKGKRSGQLADHALNRLGKKSFLSRLLIACLIQN